MQIVAGVAEGITATKHLLVDAQVVRVGTTL
jgi:hypothetical protein